jgi:hypothetical protein
MRRKAGNVYAALRHTHLLGRHLVLEWAEEQDLDALRKKAGLGREGYVWEEAETGPKEERGGRSWRAGVVTVFRALLVYCLLTGVRPSTSTSWKPTSLSWPLVLYDRCQML